jgi:hypothetical protein
LKNIFGFAPKAPQLTPVKCRRAAEMEFLVINLTKDSVFCSILCAVLLLADLKKPNFSLVLKILTKKCETRKT